MEWHVIYTLTYCIIYIGFLLFLHPRKCKDQLVWFQVKRKTVWGNFMSQISFLVSMWQAASRVYCRWTSQSPRLSEKDSFESVSGKICKHRPVSIRKFLNPGTHFEVWVSGQARNSGQHASQTWSCPCAGWIHMWTAHLSSGRGGELLWAWLVVVSKVLGVTRYTNDFLLTCSTCSTFKLSEIMWQAGVHFVVSSWKKHSRHNSRRYFSKHCFKCCFHICKMYAMWCGWLAMPGLCQDRTVMRIFSMAPEHLTWNVHVPIFSATPTIVTMYFTRTVLQPSTPHPGLE